MFNKTTERVSHKNFSNFLPLFIVSDVKKFCWTKLHHCRSISDDLWFFQGLCEVLSSFNPKEFYYSYAWSCAVYVKDGLLFSWDFSLENSVNSCLCF